MNGADHQRAQPIRLRRVSKSFREGASTRAVLEGIDLEVAAGERVALVGRSGSGKSTLLNLVAGLDHPSEGSIEVMGHDLVALSEAERTTVRRRHIGFVFQSFNLIPTLTVEENVLLPLDLVGGLDRATRDRAVARLAALGLGDRRDSFPDVLSGGEQQRVAIARALAHGPRLLLADEPTGNLDEATAETVLEMLIAGVRETGVSLLVATHSQRVAALADRVLGVEGGRLVARTGS